MGFRKGAYAKVWSWKDGNGNYKVAEMSTSKKEGDGYQTDWSNKFVRLVGTAAKQIESLGDSPRVRIGECDVTNNFDKAKQTLYTNYVILSFEEEDGEQKKPTATKKSTTGRKPAPKQEDDFMDVSDDESDIPFN